MKLRPSQHKLSGASLSQVARPGVQGPRFSQFTHPISPPHVLRPRTSVSSFLRPRAFQVSAPPSSLGLRPSQSSLHRAPPLKRPRLLAMKTRPFPNSPAPLPLSHAPASRPLGRSVEVTWAAGWALSKAPASGRRPIRDLSQQEANPGGRRLRCSLSAAASRSPFAPEARHPLRGRDPSHLPRRVSVGACSPACPYRLGLCSAEREPERWLPIPETPGRLSSDAAAFPVPGVPPDIARWFYFLLWKHIENSTQASLLSEVELK